MRTTIISLLFLFILVVRADSSAAVLPPNQDTTIRILFVHDPLTASDRITAQINFLLNTWNNTGLSTTTPTTITIANNGNALQYTGGFLTGTADVQIQKLKDFVTPNLRQLHGADVVIGITDLIDNSPTAHVCGRAPQNFGLDLIRLLRIPIAMGWTSAGRRPST
jgi:hypothetical protein